MFQIINTIKKRVLCSLFVFLIGFIFNLKVQAQNFTACFNYEIGSINTYKLIHNLWTSDFINTELNKKGANVIWNLHDTAIVYGGGEAIQEIWQANLVNGYNSFTGSNIVKKFHTEFDQFMIQDSSGIYLVGQLSFPITKYVNYKKLINYPHGLFEFSIDSFSMDSMQNFVGGWSTDIHGTSQNCFDAEGQIYFQSGIIVSAYRYTRIDTLKYLSDGQPAMQVEMETYWYESDCNMHTPLIYAKGYQDANGFQHYNSIYILKDYALGNTDIANSQKAGFSASIDNDKLIVNNNLKLGQAITLIDLEGRIIYQKDLQPLQEKVTINTSNFASGIYYVQSNLGYGQKIVITH